ncbi:ATP-dependent zinc metalloprotease FtsH [Gossypium australe]|uniref:ATP-dependent zinc metalloprotease FtsH n=1 Tax=Gossypium australe TaxID=47621 RepID=A0A5B6VLT3_9ROSI|nr:ATP-dependent zinc metalloprotease FtsH [Gossypium australe]
MWDYFLVSFQKKYVGAIYVKAIRLEFIELRQGNMFIADYEAEFLRPSCCAPGMVVDEQYKCNRFEFGLRSDLKMQVAPLQERVYEALVEKTKICGEVRCYVDGSTHSYVSRVMVEKLGIRVDETVSDVTIISPFEKFVHVNKIYK